MNKAEYEESAGQRLLAMSGEISLILERLNLGHSAANVDAFSYSTQAHKGAPTYLHFQLHSPMTDYRTAVAYIEGQLAKARTLFAQPSQR